MDFFDKHFCQGKLSQEIDLNFGFGFCPVYPFQQDLLQTCFKAIFSFPRRTFLSFSKKISERLCLIIETDTARVRIAANLGTDADIDVDAVHAENKPVERKMDRCDV